MIKSKPLRALAAACCIFTAVPSQAGIIINDPGYGVASYYTYAGSGVVASYDWAANGSLYYMVQTPMFAFGGLNQVAAGVTTTVVAGSSDFAGASVVSLGDYVYFNTSAADQKIYKYGPVSGAASSALVSTTANYGLYAHGGKVLITGSPDFTTSYLYESGVDGSGNLTNNPALAFGNVDSGGSGPLAFDNVGNLYYSPGYGDHSIYKWSASQVSSALADPVGSGLSLTGQLWKNYDSLYSSVSGATSLLVDGNGSLLVTFTDFSAPSVLVAFGIDGSGNFSGSNTTILSDTGRLGDLRQHDGATYLSSDNGIYQLAAVPEPATVASLVIGLALVAFVSWRRREQGAR